MKQLLSNTTNFLYYIIATSLVGISDLMFPDERAWNREWISWQDWQEGRRWWKEGKWVDYTSYKPSLLQLFGIG